MLMNYKQGPLKRKYVFYDTPVKGGSLLQQFITILEAYVPSSCS